MATDERHNGWTNYATWRINLELADDVVQSMAADTEQFADTYDLAKAIQERCEEAVTNYGELEGLAVDYAMAFMDGVNWYEIAEHAAEEYAGIAGYMTDEDGDADDDDERTCSVENCGHTAIPNGTMCYAHSNLAQL
jgi:hypothetical protein